MDKTNEFIPDLFGSCIPMGTHDFTPNVGYVFLAGSTCVKWAGGSPLHPAQIESIALRGLPIKVATRKVVRQPATSWVRGGRVIHVPELDCHTLIFNPVNTAPIIYKDFVTP